MLGYASDLLRVLKLLPDVESGRRSAGFRDLVSRFRARGASLPARSRAGRQRLRRVIRVVDRFMPNGANCYRRVLLEMALDPEAAREPLQIGLRENGGPRSGHIWLANRDASDRYDAEFVT